MATRNFWVVANIDGRATQLTGGPRSKDGGFDLTVYIRDNGGILKALVIRGWARNDGNLILTAEAVADNVALVGDDNEIKVVTQR